MAFYNLNPYIQALIGTLFTFLVTTMGAAVVYFFKKVNKKVLDIMLAFAGGIMISASFFSLINPAIEMTYKLNINTWITISIGFLLGGLFLFISDKSFNKILSNKNNSLKRIILLILSITIHNIPEGLVVGVSFASAYFNIDGASITSAIILTIGIALQNFPEGCAISLPLRREGLSLNKSFLYGTLSGIVEPISGVIGALLVLKIRLLLPFLLSFAAGAMIYVVISEIIPESQTNNNKELMSISSLIGFTIMMILDIALG